MPVYHFVQSAADVPQTRTLPKNRISVTYGAPEDPHLGSFRELEHTSGDYPKMGLRNCEGSFILIDRGRALHVHPINKLHFGTLKIDYPHAESYEKGGVESTRVDLAYLDSQFATQALTNLTMWRNLGYRAQQREKFLGQQREREEFLLERKQKDAALELEGGGALKKKGPSKSYNTQYGIPFRLAQLQISPAGLEHEIRYLERRIEYLQAIEAERRIEHADTIMRDDPEEDSRNKGRTIYEHVTAMEQLCYDLVGDMKKATLTCESKKNRPNFVVSEKIFAQEKEIGLRMRAVLRTIEDIMTPAEMDLAGHYWREIASWGER